MDVWGTLLATVAGAAIALVGQQLVRRSEQKARIVELLLEQCALVAASSSDFQHRVWEERHLGSEGRVAAWDLSAQRLATARLHILSKDDVLLTSLDHMNKAGQRLGSRWRGNVDDAEFSDLWDQHARAVEAFVAASGAAVGRRLAHS